MRAGLLTEIIDILSPNKVVSEYGEEKTEYIKSYRTRAQVVVQPSSREVSNDEIVYANQYDLRVRYYVPVEEFDLIVWHGKRYRILSIQPKREWNEKMLKIEKINE